MGNANLPHDRVLVGRLIANRYLVEGLCERTDGCSSYRAYHLGLDRSVLLRVLPERRAITQDACRRALELADRVSTLPNAHLGRTLDVGLVAGRFPFAVYEFSKGRSLAAILTKGGPLGIERLLTLGRQLTSALETAHEAGLIHGSLRLEHLWLEALAGRPEWLRLLGFGLSELPGCEFERAGSGVFPSAGERPTPADTLARANVDAHLLAAPEPSTQGMLRAELHALGACLYQLATGTPPPWTSEPVATRLEAELARAAGTEQRALGRGITRMIQRCLGLGPHEHDYENLAEVSHELEHLAALSSVVLSAPPGSSRAPVTVHAPAARARVALGGPKVIVQGA